MMAGANSAPSLATLASRTGIAAGGGIGPFVDEKKPQEAGPDGAGGLK
jgi:hypothetical protein